MSTLQDKSSQGFAHIILIVVAAVIVIALGVAAYFAFSNALNPEARLVKTDAQKATDTACKVAVKDDTFCIFASTWGLSFGTDSVYTSTTVTDQGTLVFQSDGKGNNSSTLTKDGTVVYGTVTIGTTYYTKNPTGDGWYKTDTTPSDNTNSTADVQTDLTFNDKTTQDKTVYKNLGTEACGSLTCYKYEITNPDSPNTTTTMWFDNHDYKMRKTAFTSDGNTTEMTYSYDSVTISEPSPIVVQPDYSTMTVEQLQALSAQYSQQ